ncbi:MAG: phosphoribosyl-AMP cyclohydrolase [Lentisphaeria bacterium]|jgi:phosphoribosyl-AMP cyclohydrolase
MHNPFYKSLETICTGDAIVLQECISQLTFNTQGLIPVVTQDATSHQVLMLAWMNKEALELTLSTKRMTYWSRSRKQLWVKGETSGHSQTLVSMSFDCDGDSILCRVDQIGAACHTGRAECFYLRVDNDKQKIIVS